MKNFKKYTIISIVYSIAIFILSASPRLGGGIEFPFFDKILHFIAFMILAFLLIRAIKENSSTNKYIFYTIIISALYGISLEVVQYYIPGRECNFWDWIADFVGTLVGIFISIPRVRLHNK
ncbi:VanZ family protein [bacterium]|nr:MAG: VanZ family protein [bacterium]